MLLVCEWLARYSQDAADQVGLVRFADEADAVAPVPAARAHEVLAQGLEDGRSVGGGTRLTPAVGGATRLLADPRGARDVVLLVTDGQVGESDADLRTLVERLRANANAVYLLALDHDGAWRKHTHRRYDDLGLDGVIPIGRLSAGRLAYSIATVLMHETGLQAAGSR